MRSALLCLLFATTGLLVGANASAEEQSHEVQDTPANISLRETVEEHDLKTFEINELVSTPQVVMRQPAAQLYVKEVYFKPYFRGLLFKRGDEAVLHCYVHYIRPNFIQALKGRSVG